MEISKIWISQKSLRRHAQIPSMIQSLLDGGTLPPITLCLCEDGEIQVENGHHRLAAIYFIRPNLEPHEFLLISKNQWKPRFGKIEKLAK